MGLFRKPGAETPSPEESSERETHRIYRRAYDIYNQLVEEGTIKDLVHFKTGGKEKDAEIERIWEMVAAKLREEGIEPTEEAYYEFMRKLDDEWGLANVGVDY